MAQPETKADALHSDAEKLLSAVNRGLIRFEDIPVLPGMPIGGIGVARGTKGEGAFRAYIKQPPVVARLVSQGFVESGKGAPHPWHLIKGKGVVSPADKVICQSPRRRAQAFKSAAGAAGYSNTAPRAFGRYYDRRNGCRDRRPRRALPRHPPVRHVALKTTLARSSETFVRSSRSRCSRS